jgi:hypothetical protein
VVVAVLAGGLTYAVRRDDDGASDGGAAAEPVVDRPAAGLVVDLTRAGLPSGPVVAGGAVPFAVEASGVAGIAAMELWAGDEVVANRVLEPADAPSVRTLLEWTPTEIGSTVVTARAVDTEGRNAQSEPIRTEVIEAGDPVPWVSHVSQTGETLADFAARIGVDVDTLVLADPDLPRDGPLPDGTTVDAPQVEASLPAASPDLVPPELRGLLTATSPTTSDHDVTNARWSEGFPVRVRPAATTRRQPQTVPQGELLVLPQPDLVVTIDDDDCSADLEVANASEADHVVIEMLTPTAPTFDPIAIVEGENGNASTPIGPGSHVFVATSTDGTASAISAPIVVNGPGACEGTWTGDIKLVNGVLSGGAPAEVAYLYLSSSPGQWIRVPSATGAFVPANDDGTFGFLGHLPPITGKRLQLEAWGWSEGSLVRIGSATFVPENGLSIGDVIGAFGTTSLRFVAPPSEGGQESLVTEAYVGDEPGMLSFRWSTTLPGVTHGVWQVTTFPPDPSGPLDPVGVVAQGVTQGDGGDFEIDFGKITGQPQTLTIGDAPLSYVAMAGGFGVAGGSAPPPPGDAAATTPTTPGGSGASANTATAIPADVLAGLDLPDATQFFVRLLPFSKDFYKGVPSNDVRIDTSPLLDPGLLEALAEALPDKPYELDFTFTRPEAPNLAKVACWKFKGWNPNLGDPKAVQAATGQDVGPLTPAQQQESFLWSAYLKIYAAHGYGVSICPGYCYKVSGGSVALAGGKCGGGGFDPFGDLLGALISVGTVLWDKVIVGTFNAVKGFAVDTLADACTAFGDGLLGSGQTGDECGVLAEVAVDAVLLAFGIPPTLPTTEQAIQLGKGELQELMVELAEDLGVPCDEIGTTAAAAGHPEYSCEAVAEMLLDQLDDKIQESFRQQAAAVSGLQFPPGMEMVPDPVGQITPSRFDVTVSPTVIAPPSGETCKATSSISSFWFTGPANPFSQNAWVSVKGLDGQMIHTPTGKIGSVLAATLPPRVFKGLPFTAGGWKLPTPQPGADGALAPATKSYYLYQPNPYDPVPVTLAIQDPGGFNEPSKVVFKPSEVPFHSFLLQPDAAHNATMFGSCFGFAAGNLSIDLAAPQTQGVGG